MKKDNKNKQTSEYAGLIFCITGLIFALMSFAFRSMTTVFITIAMMWTALGLFFLFNKNHKKDNKGDKDNE